MIAQASSADNWLVRHLLSEPAGEGLGAPEALANDWLRALHGEGRSQHTIRGYARAVTLWIAFVRSAGLPLAPSAITREHCSAWASALRDAGMGHNTRILRENVVRAWFRWLLLQGEISADPWQRIRRQRLDVPPMQPPTVEQMQALITAAGRLHGRAKSPTWLAARDPAILAVLFDTGLRASELLSLRRQDIGQQQAFTVLGKGRRHRTVMLSDNVYMAVRKYVRAYERAHGPLDADAPLWQGIRGPLGVRGLGLLVESAGKAAGVEVHPHLLRHSFASRFLEAGGDRWSVQVLLGHSTSEMVTRYTSTIEGSKALREHQEKSPARGLKL
jgi:integrase/recombinase XerD